MRTLRGIARNDVLARCRDAVRRAEAGADVILYGSRARGDWSEESDFDILVLVDGPVPLSREERVRDELCPLELETGAVLTVVVESRARWRSSIFQAMPFVQNVEREGAIL